MEIKLAEALLRRKELQMKVEQLKGIAHNTLFEVKVKRAKVTDDVDDIVAQVPKLTVSQFTAEYDYYARALRQIDAVIQQANWTCGVTVTDTMMNGYQA